MNNRPQISIYELKAWPNCHAICTQTRKQLHMERESDREREKERDTLRDKGRYRVNVK